jgi:hypothetical protein
MINMPLSMSNFGFLILFDCECDTLFDFNYNETQNCVGHKITMYAN